MATEAQLAKFPKPAPTQDTEPAPVAPLPSSYPPLESPTR